MTEQDKKQLQFEIDCIFESGANEIRIFEMVERFIKQRSLINTLPIDVVIPFPTEEEIEVSADKWCDERAESYNAQHFAYTQGAQYIIDVLKGKA